MLSLSKRALSRCQLINVFGIGVDASSSNMTDFSCQCIKLVGKKPRVDSRNHELSFAKHVRELDAGQDISGSPK